MDGKFRITPRLLSEPFWDAMLLSGDERAGPRARLMERLEGLEQLRAQAAYNTGSVSLATAWCLYNLVRYFGLRRAAEVGTFIGKTTLAMASAMDDDGATGEVATCDASNDLRLPWAGQTEVRQFPNSTSTRMFAALDGTFDLLMLDGRLQADDLAHVERLTTPATIIALDDFEGFEKGVANLAALSRLPKFRSHLLIYPPSRTLLAAHGFTGYSLLAVLLPAARIEFARQG